MQEPEAKHKVFIDETLTEAVFSLDWFCPAYAILHLTLIHDEPAARCTIGAIRAIPLLMQSTSTWAFASAATISMPGTWTLQVERAEAELDAMPYQVLVSGQTRITLHLLLPDRLGVRYTTGNRVPIYALLTANGPIPDAMVEAFVTAPDGTETRVQLSDDGRHGDGQAADGLYAGLYTLVNQADAVQPTGEDGQSEPKDEGGYRVVARATHPKFQREALGAFSVLEGGDGNGNRLPDVWEKENKVNDPGADPDLDGLTNYWEYMHGTDPHNPDTDGGGEKDGSEVENERDPLTLRMMGSRRPVSSRSGPYSRNQ